MGAEQALYDAAVDWAKKNGYKLTNKYQPMAPYTHDYQAILAEGRRALEADGGLQAGKANTDVDNYTPSGGGTEFDISSGIIDDFSGDLGSCGIHESPAVSPAGC